MDKFKEGLKEYPSFPNGIESFIERNGRTTSWNPAPESDENQTIKSATIELRYDPKFIPPFRVGNKRTVLDSKGHEVIILNSELQAKLYCDYLNQ